jgi:hypothetical protein
MLRFSPPVEVDVGIGVGDAVGTGADIGLDWMN